VTYEQANNRANFYVANDTTGQSQSAVMMLASSYYDGDSADWIDERARLGLEYAHLPNFGAVNWTSCRAMSGTGTWYNLSALDNRRYTMKSDTGTNATLATPTVIYNNSSFIDTFYLDY
jgi:hypothetical protein